jgi:hypothetical protein
MKMINNPVRSMTWGEQEQQSRERDQRVGAAIDNRRAARESAANICTALFEGHSETERTIRMSRREQLQDALLAFVGVFEDEGDQFLQSMMCHDVAYRSQSHMDWTVNKLRDQSQYIRRLVAGHKGGDIDDDRLIRAEEFLTRLQESLMKWEDLHEAAKAVYETVADKPWVPSPNGQPIELKARTEAARSALARAGRYMTQTGKQAGARNGAPHPAFDDDIPF